jgi:type IV secretion system protein VirD4
VRADDWGSTVQPLHAELRDARDSDDAEGGLQHERHPSIEDQAPARDAVDDPAVAMAEDDGDLAADQRAMDQARGLTPASRGFGLNDAGHRDLILGL